MKKFFCTIFGHHFSVSKKVTSHIKEYKCVHCGKQVTTDVTGNLSALTPQLKEINDTLASIYQKRHLRGTPQQVA
jgi:transposase-like protein